MSNDSERRELLKKCLKHWKHTGEFPKIKFKTEISPSPIQKYFTSDGDPKVIFHDDGTTSVGMGRFYEPDDSETWHEFDGYRVQYGELPPKTQKTIHAELKRIEQRTKRLLVSKPGRPLGTGTFQNAEEFREVIGKIIRELDEQGKKPLQKIVADTYDCNVRQLRDWCKEFTGLKWQDFVTEILDS